MGHIIVSGDHHIWVFIHLVLLGTAALVETHFSKWARNSVIVLSHVAHHLHVRAYGPCCPYLRVDPLLGVTIPLGVRAHLSIVLGRKGVRYCPWNVQNPVSWGFELIISLSQGLTVLILVLSLVICWWIRLWHVPWITWVIVRSILYISWVRIILRNKLTGLIIVNSVVSILCPSTGQ